MHIAACQQQQQKQQSDRFVVSSCIAGGRAKRSLWVNMSMHADGHIVTGRVVAGASCTAAYVRIEFSPGSRPASDPNQVAIMRGRRPG